jgi:hypothetical protein
MKGNIDMKFDAIELTDAELLSVYGGQGGSNTDVPIGIPVNITDLEVLDLLGHVLGPVSSTLGASNPAGSYHASHTSESGGDDD